MIEAGHVFLPEKALWLEEFLDQWTAFPAAAHDDMVDSSTQALSWLLNANGQAEQEMEEPGETRDLWEVYG